MINSGNNGRKKDVRRESNFMYQISYDIKAVIVSVFSLLDFHILNYIYMRKMD